MKLLFIFGTRPEAIKMAPLILTASKNAFFDVRICVTGQHSEMLYQVLDFFNIKPDYDLNVMKPDQSLYDVTANILKSLENVIKKESPALVLVQGDTTTAFTGALASYYQKVPVAHIEAGLRSHDKYSPFPEEINRTLIGPLTDYHFTPTKRAAENLRAEGISRNIWIVGNTVIDAMFLGLDIVRKNDAVTYSRFFEFVDFSKKVILVTGHRRESFGKPFENICFALHDIVRKFDDVEIIYPVHLNPNIGKPVRSILNNLDRIHLIDPVEYPYLLWLMSKSYIVLTDSGGIQEEAPSLGKPVLVMREVTERMEGIEAGTAKLVGTNREKIVAEVSNLLENRVEYEKMARAVNPYGDGKTADRIIEIISKKIPNHAVET